MQVKRKCFRWIMTVGNKYVKIAYSPMFPSHPLSFKHRRHIFGKVMFHWELPMWLTLTLLLFVVEVQSENCSSIELDCYVFYHAGHDGGAVTLIRVAAPPSSNAVQQAIDPLMYVRTWGR